MADVPAQPDGLNCRLEPRKRAPPIAPVLALVVLVNLSMSLYQLPLNRLIERRLCGDYYGSTDPSLIQLDGSIDEKLCKVAEIEKSLGRIQGVMETLWVSGGEETKSSR